MARSLQVGIWHAHCRWVYGTLLAGGYIARAGQRTVKRHPANPTRVILGVPLPRCHGFPAVSVVAGHKVDGGVIVVSECECETVRKQERNDRLVWASACVLGHNAS
jgi:hypothetical protein